MIVSAKYRVEVLENLLFEREFIACSFSYIQFILSNIFSFMIWVVLLSLQKFFVYSELPSPCTSFSRAILVNSIRWRIRGKRVGNASLLRSDHVGRNALAARNNEA